MITIDNKINLIDKNNPLLDEAKKFLGKRVQLVDAFENSISVEEKERLEKIIDIHTDLMLETRKDYKGFMWEATFQGKTDYLIGTVHGRLMIQDDQQNIDLTDDESVKKLGAQWIDPYLQELIKKTNKMYLEFNIFDTTNEETVETLFELARLSQKANENIEFDKNTLYTKKVAKHVIDVCSTKKSQGMDALLWIFMREKTIRSLEEGEAQVQALKEMLSIRPFTPEGKLNLTLTFEQELSLIDAFQWQNYESLQKYGEKEAKILSLPSMISRNANFTSKIFSGFQKGKNAMYAIGCLHMIGEHGVLNLLEKQGVKISKIKI